VRKKGSAGRNVVVDECQAHQVRLNNGAGAMLCHNWQLLYHTLRALIFATLIKRRSKGLKKAGTDLGILPLPDVEDGFELTEESVLHVLGGEAKQTCAMYGNQRCQMS